MRISIHGEQCCHGFVATQTETGFSWTLTSAFGRLLSEAEEYFGPRDMAWTPLGVEFGNLDIPKIWYPDNRRAVSIILAKSARHDSNRALFQLAHEVVHVLSPSGEPRAPRIEEGLATLFADEKSTQNEWGYQTMDARYLSAKKDVYELLSIDAASIKAIRSKQPNFILMTPELIKETVLGVPHELASALCQPF